MEGCGQRKTLSHSFEAINSLKSCQKRGFAGARHWRIALRLRVTSARAAKLASSLERLNLRLLRISFLNCGGTRYVCPSMRYPQGNVCRRQAASLLMSGDFFVSLIFLRLHAARRRQIGKRLFIWRSGSPRCRHGDTSKMERIRRCLQLRDGGCAGESISLKTNYR